MRVIAFDPALPSDAPAWDVADQVDLSDIYALSDVISLHVPLNDNTRNMIDQVALSAMKQQAVLINTARGGIVDESALATALREGQLRGAALDVFNTEPPSGEDLAPFAGLANIILTPHIAGLTSEANERVSKVTIDNVIRVLEERT